MIGFLMGEFESLTPSSLYVNVHGVGYEVHITLNTYHVIAQQTSGRLFTHLLIKEDAHTLFGFAALEEKEAFLKLISVSGVGASTARLILSSLTVSELEQIIQSGNHKSLEKVKGIGAKTAQRLILELKGKLVAIHTTTALGQGIHNTNENDALNALIGLGISKNLAEAAILKVKDTALEANWDVEQWIKSALKNI